LDGIRASVATRKTAKLKQECLLLACVKNAMAESSWWHFSLQVCINYDTCFCKKTKHGCSSTKCVSSS